MVYSPGCKLEILNRPESSVVAMSSLLVPAFLTDTVAPGTTSLFGFITVPPIAPVVVLCAMALRANAKTISNEPKLNRTNLVITGELLNRNQFVLNLVRASRRAQS